MPRPRLAAATFAHPSILPHMKGVIHCCPVGRCKHPPFGICTGVVDGHIRTLQHHPITTLNYGVGLGPVWNAGKMCQRPCASEYSGRSPELWCTIGPPPPTLLVWLYTLIVVHDVHNFFVRPTVRGCRLNPFRLLIQHCQGKLCRLCRLTVGLHRPEVKVGTCAKRPENRIRCFTSYSPLPPAFCIFLRRFGKTTRSAIHRIGWEVQCLVMHCQMRSLLYWR